MEMPPRIGPLRPRRVYLALWREYYDLTQDALGERFHTPVSKSTISRWEAAQPYDKALTKGVIEAYAEALNRPVEDMYRSPPPKGTTDDPSLDVVAAELDIDRQAVIGVLKALGGRRRR